MITLFVIWLIVLCVLFRFRKGIKRELRFFWSSDFLGYFLLVMWPVVLLVFLFALFMSWLVYLRNR